MCAKLTQSKQPVVPSHVAVIMDGNGRWAKKRLLPRIMGHRAAIKRVKELVRSAADLGVETLTLFAFSTENWSRPKEEVSNLMRIFTEVLKSEVAELHQNQVKINFIGDLDRLAKPIQDGCQQAVELMKNNAGLKLNIAINYGGQWDLTVGAQALAKRVQTGELSIDAINPEKLHDALPSASVPAVDLLIRTSGEQRMSNFLIWQLAYAEFYFTDIHFPDFDRKAFEKALNWYVQGERRFGKTSAQITE